MTGPMTAEEIRQVGAVLEGCELPADFQMPTLEELENDLALGNPGWKEILRPSGDQTGGPGVSQARGFRSGRIPGLAAWIAGAMLGALCIAGVEAATNPHQGVSARPTEAHLGSTQSATQIIWTARGPIYIRDLNDDACPLASDQEVEVMSA